MESYRIELEQAIIGACLLENCYDRIANIITYKNFTASESTNHQAIFKAIESMYPTEPIDILTVVHKVNLPDCASYIAHCMSSVSSTANLRYHALILLELSMRDVLIDTLVNASKKELSIVTKATIQEIIDECLDHSSDILEIFERAPEHLRTIGSEDILIKEIENLYSSLREKISKIKKQAHVDCLFQNLERLRDGVYDTKSKLCLTELTEVIKTILITGNVSDQDAEKILSLSMTN